MKKVIIPHSERFKIKNLWSQMRPEAPSSLPEVEAVPGATARDMAFLMQLGDVLECHMGQEDFDVRALSQAMGMSRMHLHRKMKALLGQSPGQYLRRQRLLRAQYLLRHTEYSVGEVAYLSGFKEHANFTRAYKQEFGRLPRER